MVNLQQFMKVVPCHIVVSEHALTQILLVFVV